MHASVKGI